MLAIALVLAAAGWGLETQTRVESDVQKLVPQDLSALRDLRELQRSSGVGGEIDVMVQTDDLTDPAVVEWMTAYQQRILRRFGYGPKRSCGKAVLCPAFSLTNLFNTSSVASQGGKQTTAQIKELLDAVPPYFSRGVISSDRKVATLAFGIRLMPLDKQQRVIETMRRELRPAARRPGRPGRPARGRGPGQPQRRGDRPALPARSLRACWPSRSCWSPSSARRGARSCRSSRSRSRRGGRRCSSSASGSR